jgi:hypothetical protein
MADAKTTPTDADVTAFLAAVEPPVRRTDGEALRALMGEVTGEPAVLWGPSMIGFGHHHYRYESGHEGDIFAVGFSPRRARHSLYGLTNAPGSEALLERLGKHRRGAGCVYVTRLADVDLDVLRELVALAHRWAAEQRR